jgi:hypothetical protein
MRLDSSITTVPLTATAYEYALKLMATWEIQRRWEEIYARAEDSANRADNEDDIETALDQMDTGEDMAERGYSLTVELSKLAAAAGAMNAVLSIAEPLYRL